MRSSAVPYFLCSRFCRRSGTTAYLSWSASSPRFIRLARSQCHWGNRVDGVLGTVQRIAGFLTFNAISRGPNEGVPHDSPTRKEKFFTGFSDLLFMFGGHTAAIEKADVTGGA